MDTPAGVVLAAFLVTASGFDLISRRVPNVLNGTAVAAGLALAAAGGAFLGNLVAALAGFLAGFLLYAVGAMRGGDGKMLAAVGAIAGLRFLTDAGVATLAVGALVSAIVLARHGALAPLFRRLGDAVIEVAILQEAPEGPLIEGKGHTIPFAPVIATGCVIAWLANSRGWSLLP